MKKLFRGAMLGDRSSRWSVIAVVITFLAAGYGQGAADVSVGGATSASQQCLETDWVARYDDVFNLYDAANAITVDSDRNSYVTGEICALVDPLYGLCSVTGWGTVKYDPNGNQLWVQTFRGPGSWFNRPNAIAVDSANNVYVTGSISITPGCDVESCDPYGSDLDYATIKYSSAGEQLWVARYSGVGGSGVDEAFALALDSSGNVYVTGLSKAANGLSDYATIKYNSSGSQIWVARYNGPGNASDDARAIKVDSTGNVYVTGGSTGANGFLDYATIKYSPSGSQLWVARYDGPGSGEDDAKGLVVDSSGNAIVTGYSLSAATAYDYATIKYDTLGNELWVARYDGQASAYDLASAIALDSVGNVFVTGFSSGAGTNFDYATIKYDSNGNQVWVARYDGPGHMGDYATAIALDSSGNVHVTGRSVDGTGNWSDYATIRYSPDGVQTRESRYDGPGSEGDFGFRGLDDFASALAVDQNGNVYVTGGSISGVFAGMWLGDYATIKYSQPEEGCPPPVNQPPGVNAGPDQTITLPGSTYLVGTVSDDGLPNPPWAVTTTWSKVSGPGTVTFGNAAAVNTTASFSVAGSYVLRLTANDSALQASDDISVTVNSGGTNHFPSVNAGPDQTITLPSVANLDGTVSDDGLPNPPGAVTTTWSKVSGPGTATFGNANAVDTTASFSAAGSYVLRLTANDSALQASDDISVTVNSAGPSNRAPSVNAGPDQTIKLLGVANLDGTVSDDGLPNPPRALTTTWSKVSGPGTVIFGNANAVDTTASFSAAGSYVLRLTASDSALQASDDISIRVKK